MTVSNNKTKHVATGDGATTEFSASIKVQSATDIGVYFVSSDGALTLLTQDTDYEVTVGTDSVTVDFPLAGSSYDELESDEKLVIFRSMDFKQSTDLTSGIQYSSNTQENALDKIVMMLQEVREVCDRAVKVGIEDESTDPDDLKTTLLNASALASLASEFGGELAPRVALEDTGDETIEVKEICTAVSDDDTTLITTSADASLDITESGAGGLDETSSLTPSTSYAIFLIYDPTSATASLLASSDFTNPSLPTGYTKKRLVSFFRLNSSSDIVPFQHRGTRYDFLDTDSELELISADPGAITALDFSDWGSTLIGAVRFAITLQSNAGSPTQVIHTREADQELFRSSAAGATETFQCALSPRLSDSTIAMKTTNAAQSYSQVVRGFDIRY